MFCLDKIFRSWKFVGSCCLVHFHRKKFTFRRKRKFWRKFELGRKWVGKWWRVWRRIIRFWRRRWKCWSFPKIKPFLCFIRRLWLWKNLEIAQRKRLRRRQKPELDYLIISKRFIPRCQKNCLRARLSRKRQFRRSFSRIQRN